MGKASIDRRSLGRNLAARAPLSENATVKSSSRCAIVLVLSLGAGCGGAPADGPTPAFAKAEATDTSPTTKASEAPTPASSTPASSTPASSTPASSEAPAPASAPAAVRAAPPAKKTTVLHVGDSFVHSGLTQRLRKLLEPIGVRYEVRAEKSTNSLDWAKRVPDEVASTKPDLVIVTLGGNEIGSKHLDVQARAIERIVKAIGNRPCVWTTPPLWMTESGLFDTIQQHVAPCRFFETDEHVGKYIPRREDKIHPTMDGGAMWADKLFDYLLDERTGDAERPWDLKAAPSPERTPRGIRGPLPH